jgi:hypothetical protein
VHDRFLFVGLSAEQPGNPVDPKDSGLDKARPKHGCCITEIFAIGRLQMAKPCTARLRQRLGSTDQHASDFDLRCAAQAR